MRIIKPEQIVYDVPVLQGAAEELVLHRELRNAYHTNRSIKAWSCYFLLKSLTSSGLLKNWLAQKEFLLQYCKVNENTFRSHLRELIRLQLLTINENFNLSLVSYERSALIMGIDFAGTTKIKYDTSQPGKQVFQYLLRAQEIRNNQQKQLDALCYKADKIPLLKQSLMNLLTREGLNEKQLLKDDKFFQEKLLKLQEKSFRYGTDIPEIVHALRADINRGVKKIRDDHKYLSAQSVSYMKSVMAKLNLITVEKKMIRSKERSRLYVPDGVGGRREAFKWLPKLKETAWRLTDQINVNYPPLNKKNEKKPAAAA